MNKPLFSRSENTYQLHENFDLELSANLHNVSNLISKSLKIPLVIIALVYDDYLLLNSNEKAFNGHVANSQQDTFKQSLTLPTLSAKKIIIEDLATEEINYSSVQLQSNTGSTLGFLAITANISREFSSHEMDLLQDFAKVATEIIDKHKNSKKLQEVFNDFVHKTVHDLKNPFTTISLTTELLKRKSDDAKLVSSFTQRLDNANDKVFKNLERLKSAFPLNKESFKLNIQEINLDDLILAVRQKTSLEIIVENQFEGKIHGDHPRLVEAVIQLINHLSLISKEMPTISIKIYAEENQLQIAITNNNMREISVEVIENTESTALAISKKLLEMHYGKISFKIGDAFENFGFYITLPLL